MNEGLNLIFVTLIFMNFSLEELRNYGGGKKLSGFWTRRRWLVSESSSPTNVNATYKKVVLRQGVLPTMFSTTQGAF